MNRQRGLTAGLCVSLLFLNLSSSSSAASQITGTKCVKAGTFRTAKNVRYQCKKSAQGLRWVITSTEGTPTTTTSSTSTTSTTTTTTTIVAVPSDSVARKVYDLVVAAMTSSVTSASSIEFVSEVARYESEESRARLDASKATDLFAKLGFPLPTKTIVFFSQTDAGLRRMALEKGCEQQSLQNESLAGGGYAIPGRCSSGEVVVIAGAIQNWASQGATIGFHHVLPHELFHQWQMTNTSNCVSWQCGNADFPKWLWEGTPQFMTRFVYWSWNRSKDPSQWLDHWYKVERTDMFTNCKGVSIEQMVDPHAPWFNPNWCAYSKGQLAIEVLVANYGGFETLRRLHTAKTTPGHGDFGVLFRNVTGREITDFYSEVNAYFVTRNWP